LIFQVLRLAGSQVKAPTLDIPQDIHTTYQYGLEPEIISTPCCPTCYKPYSKETLPETCDWKKSPRTRFPCGTALQKQVQTPNGSTKDVPRSLYSTQSFESWLQFFLSRPLM
jgi:hypothetical protein